MGSPNSIVLRVEKNRDYKTISLENIHDERLSWKATGIHTYLVSRPEGWDFNLADLVNRKTDGEASVKSGLRELQDAGYLRIERVRGEGGTYVGWVWTVGEVPLAPKGENQLSVTTERRKTESGKTESGKSPDVVIEESSKATTTTPLYPPVGSQPAEGGADSPAPGAAPATTTPAAAPGSPAPSTPAPLSAELEAAISQVIIAANQAMTVHPGIDQTRLRPIPTIGAGRQAVWDWIAEGIPIPLILEVVRGAVQDYQPDGHRTQISSMSYFAARVREANELRLAREAGSNEQRNGAATRNDGGRISAPRRGVQGGSPPRQGSERRKQFVYG